MGLTTIYTALVFLGLAHFASCSGTFYQRVTSDKANDAAVSTTGFHQCSLKNNCNYIGIPVINAGPKPYSAATMEELPVTSEKLQIWRKIESEHSKDDSSNEKGERINVYFQHFCFCSIQMKREEFPGSLLIT